MSPTFSVTLTVIAAIVVWLLFREGTRLDHFKSASRKASETLYLSVAPLAGLARLDYVRTPGVENDDVGGVNAGA